MKRKIFLLLILCIELLTVFQLWSCVDFSGQFHYSTFDLQLRLIEDIHNDKSIPIWEVRLFHNKLIGNLFDFIKYYLQFWDISFLASFISLAGVVGLIAQFYFFLSKSRNLWIWFLFLYLIFVPFIEIFKPGDFSFHTRLIFIAVPYLIWSMLGFLNLLKFKSVDIRFLGAIIILSLWYQLVFPDISLFCSLR